MWTSWKSGLKSRTKESMYKLSYVVRIAAESEEEELETSYRRGQGLVTRMIFNIKLVRPLFGDMIGIP